MTDQLTTAPVLSTPETHIFEDPTPLTVIPKEKRFSPQEINDVYEVERTAREIGEGGWRRIALQFPDGMLSDAPRVFEALEKELAKFPEIVPKTPTDPAGDITENLQELDITKQEAARRPLPRRRLYILADTSYGACCVDEIAAEHVDADVVVHYGRSCLSPTARIPVIYVFTSQTLPLDTVAATFEETYPKKDTKVVLMADITFHKHISSIHDLLQSKGYTNIFAPAIIHDPSSPLPNRTLPPKVTAGEEVLKDYSLFHISDPPQSLLLTLSSRLESMYIYPTATSAPPTALQAQTSQLLRRRYGLLTSLTTCSIFGILINTLSVKNYLPVISTLQQRIAAAGKKSYTFVVGKVNAAKVANFSEIGGWVVVGCWESSLIDSTEFYRPIITPFELSLALLSDDDRVWTGDWTGDFSAIMQQKNPELNTNDKDLNTNEEDDSIDDSGEEDSAPPEFDLRTGRYISHSRPMRAVPSKSAGLTRQLDDKTSSALLKRATGELATINGSASPGAEYLRTQRTWTGLGSDFEPGAEEEKGSTVEQGRSGVARGYIAGEDDERR